MIRGLVLALALCLPLLHPWVGLPTKGVGPVAICRPVACHPAHLPPRIVR